jgi:hypothetical protein
MIRADGFAERDGEFKNASNLAFGVPFNPEQT